MKKKVILLGFIILFGFAPKNCLAKYSGGDGSEATPYRISNAYDMNDIGLHDEDWASHFVMVNDVNLAQFTGTEFNIIGNSTTKFTGVFDGNGFTISNFTYTSTGTNYIGLFGVVFGTNSEIKNLSLIDPNFDGGTGSFVGLLVGALNDGAITGCNVNGGHVNGGQLNGAVVGGLVGNNQGGTISNCWSTSEVSAKNVAGGLVGFNSGIVSTCYATGSVSGETQLGGLVGGASGGNITYCYATGSVLGYSQLGGLVGANGYCTIENCYSTGSVSSFGGWSGSSVGGLVGSNEGQINKCYATSSVVPVELFVGGLVGDNLGTVTDSFWDKETSGMPYSDGGTRKTTAQMQTESTFTSAGWDFTTPVWMFSCKGPGYPRLWWEPLNPVADAGADQVFGSITLPPLVSLDGSGSCDPDGDPLTYHWQQTNGPLVTLSDTNTVGPNFVPSEFGNYVFELVVNDGNANSVPDTVEIAIINQPPIADAGPDQSMSTIPASISLDGSGSYDPFSDPLTYYWQQIGGPEVVLSDPCVIGPTFVPLEFGIYVFELVVSDGLLESTPDVVGIVIGNNHTPIADAGLSRYVAEDPVVLDGTGSYDPDGHGIISYQWQQVSGPSLVITDANTATPTISGFTQNGSIQECEFELVVSDDELTSVPDTVKVIIVPDFSTGTILYSSELIQVNPPFNPNKPTILGFGGGNGITGEGMQNYGFTDWYEKVNFITVCSPDPRDSEWYEDYDPPYDRYGDMLIVYLSGKAPDYKQPIQTMGFSTGGQPAVDVGIRLNLTYADPRYAVNHVTGLDAFLDWPEWYFDVRLPMYLLSSVDGEQCWVDNYIGTLAAYWPDVLNVYFPFPPATHFTPIEWYKYSLEPLLWTTDIYNHGISAGAYWSVIGPGKNLQLNSDEAEYSYVWNNIDENGFPDTGTLEFYDELLYPGRLPEPVTLIGPTDGNTVDANGAVFSCEVSENAVNYQFLFGPYPYQMDYVIYNANSPPNETITEFPFETTWWTVKVSDQYGSTIYADPICINAENVIDRVENLNTGEKYPYIQLAIDEATNGDEIEVSEGIFKENIDFKGKNPILRSKNPDDSAVVAATIIDGSILEKSTVTFTGGVDANCVLSGFTITGGYGTWTELSGGFDYYWGGGIYCIGASPTITNNVIVGNNGLMGQENVYLFGGGIYCDSSSAVIERNIIKDNTADYGGGILCSQSNAKITNCTISGNSTTKWGGGVYSHLSDSIISNCTITGNKAGMFGGGICCKSLSPAISNCILWSNSDSVSGDEIYVIGGIIPDVNYCDIEGGWTGPTNIDDDPCFVVPGYWGDVNDCNVVVEPNDPNAVWVEGDYHLQSQAGRWDPNIQSWVNDTVTSRCVDAGNPGSDLGDEIEEPNNIRINMGTFGGTAEASKTPANWSLLGDLNNDGTVNGEDFAYTGADWQITATEQPGDLDRNGVVEFRDIKLLVQEWLEQTSWR